MMNRLIWLMLLMSTLASQNTTEYGTHYILKSDFSPFPDEKRSNGHTYQSKFYSSVDHYQDSSVLVFVPRQFDHKEPFSLLVYYHGWYNNIIKASEEFQLLKQIAESKRNCILIFPEGPKNAPDSYGGKHESDDVFYDFVGDIISQMNINEINLDDYSSVMLAGHSGAYRVISKILAQDRSSKTISHVILFDGLYGQLDVYTKWLKQKDVKFIHITTPNGGTLSNNSSLSKILTDSNVNNFALSTNELQKDHLKNHNIIFMSTTLGHNDVINPYLKIVLTHF